MFLNIQTNEQQSLSQGLKEALASFKTRAKFV